ncbi:MAG: hypothetical protein ACO3JG_10980 [Luteolibacter sp.]
MGQQLNKVIKRRRRADYLKRKKEQEKLGGFLRKPSAKSESPDAAEAKKAPAKKAAAKKAAAKKAAKKAPAKKAPAKKVESASEDQAPAAEA